VSDPPRLLDDMDGLDAGARRALHAGRRLAPPLARRVGVWAALVTKLGAATAAAATTAGATATSSVSAAAPATTALVLKYLAVGAALGATVSAGTLAVVSSDRTASTAASNRQHHDVSRPPLHTPTASARATPAAETRSRAELPLTDGPQAPAATPSLSAAATARAPKTEASAGAVRDAVDVDTATASGVGSNENRSVIRDEARRVALARAALRSGDAPAALRELTQLNADVPKGTLAQERETLAIEALEQVSAVSEAQQRGQRFLSAHPESPYAARVRSVLARLAAR
jgi:hypothetical protein